MSSEQKNKNADLGIATFNVDQDSERAKHFVLRENLQVPVYRDEDKSLRKLFHAHSVPHWVLLERVPAKGEPKWTVKITQDGSDMSQLHAALSGKAK